MKSALTRDPKQLSLNRNNEERLKVPFYLPVRKIEILYPSEISEGGILRNLLGDWGRYRVPLHPDKGTDTYGRKNFFLHGGRESGTGGCIDVGDADKDLFPLLMKLKGPISVEVK